MSYGYRDEFIAPIVALASEFIEVRKVFILEPDSLPNSSPTSTSRGAKRPRTTTRMASRSRSSNLVRTAASTSTRAGAAGLARGAQIGWRK